MNNTSRDGHPKDAEDTAIDWDFLLNEDPQNLLNGHWSQMVWRCFSKYIPDKGRILEVGCGTGRITVQAVRDGQVDAVGIDISSSSLRYARGLAASVGVRCQFIQASGFQLPFKDDSYDAVVSEGVIEHFSVRGTEAMVGEHVRVCRPGGLVIISVPNLLHLPLTYHKQRLAEKYHAYPERSYTVWGLKDLLRCHGLQPVACDGFAPSMGLQWVVSSRVRLRWLDNLRWGLLMSLIGFETLVAARKPWGSTLEISATAQRPRC